MVSESHSELTPFQRFQAFARGVVSVPKEEIDRREAAYQKQRKAKKNKSKN